MHIELKENSKRRGLLTDAWYDMELLVDLLVHGGGDDADFREGVGHRVDAHLSHEQGQQEDLILGYIVVLYRGEEEHHMTGGVSIMYSIRRNSINSNKPTVWTHQQHSDRHESSGSGGHGAVHQDDVVLTDVFGQTKVVKLEEDDTVTLLKGFRVGLL